jgi:uncharacterized lipoprotein YmbA
MMSNRRMMCVAALAAALIVAACASRPVDHFYTVSNAKGEPKTRGEPRGSGTGSAPLIAVMPVTLPALIDRPQLVVRTSAHEVGILENHRWAEPLAADLTRALIASLQRTAAGLDFESAEAAQAQKAERVLEVDIAELLSGPGPVTSLQASWILYDRARVVVKQGQLARSVPTQGGYEAIADAYADAIAQIAEAIARAIRVEPK